MIIAIIIVAGLAAFLGFAATKSNFIHITRSLDIHSPPAPIFALINDFHNWPQWSPHDRMDPTMTRNYTGAASGKGAISEWTSQGHAGRGRMEIIESTAPTKIKATVDFAKPFAVRNVHRFTLETIGEITRVEWNLRAARPYLLKVMSVFFNMEHMLEKHVDSGLLSLKEQVKK